ncbi:MAG: protein kinase [archaeon]|nr:protein kinase [archaeon]
MESLSNDVDNLGIKSLPEYAKIFSEESLLFSDLIGKLNRLNICEERGILLTNKAMYNIKKKTTIRRRTEYKNIMGFTISTSTDEFVVHVSELEDDYDYISGNKAKIIKIISENYKALTGNDLKLSKIENEKSLKKYYCYKKDKKKENTSKMDLEKAYDINKYLEEAFKEEGAEGEEIKNRPKRNSTLYSRHKDIKQVGVDDFKVLKVIGRGSYGKVCLVEHNTTHELYAMKSLKKDVLLDEDQVESTLLEKKILEKVNHPFLVGMVFCFQTEERIYFVMPFVRGGELFQHLKNEKIFSEEKVKLYAAMIGLGLGHIHQQGIIYRDIKPENILMDEEGYLKIADFGMAKILIGNEKANSFCGTPEYLSPEIILGTGHNRTSDWWSYGILIFEMLFGLPPFYCDNNERMYQLIIHSEVKFPKKIPASDNVKDFIKKLLNKNPEKRLGSINDFEDIKKHPFFSGLNFDDLLERKIKPPFVPVLKDRTDTRNFDQEFTSENVDDASLIPEKGLQNIKENQDKFEGFNH